MACSWPSAGVADGSRLSATPQVDPDPRWTVLGVLRWTSERFTARGLTTPRLDAEVLLAHALGATRIQLYLDHDKPLRAEELARMRELVRRRLGGEPVAYLVGEREFWSLPLLTDRSALIPRPETELLVELALTRARGREGPTIVDVGTGSGAIAIALARELPGATMIATDSEPAALDLARKNAARHEVTVTFLAGDLLAPLPADQRIDLLLANPPYIPSAAIATLMPEVRDHEPRVALDGGPDGLTVIRRLLDQATARLAPTGWLALEVGHDQAAAVAALMRERGLREVATHRDLAGVERVVSGRR